MADERRRVEIEVEVDGNLHDLKKIKEELERLDDDEKRRRESALSEDKKSADKQVKIAEKSDKARVRSAKESDKARVRSATESEERVAAIKEDFRKILEYAEGKDSKRKKELEESITKHNGKELEKRYNEVLRHLTKNKAEFEKYRKFIVGETTELGEDTDRYNRKLSLLGKAFRTTTSVMASFASVLAKISFIGIGGQMALFTAGLLTMKGALVAGRWAASAWQATLRGVGVAAATVTAALTAAVAALRQYQEASLVPFAASTDVISYGMSGPRLKTLGSREVVEMMNRNLNSLVSGVLGSEASSAFTASMIKAGVVDPGRMNRIAYGISDAANANPEAVAALSKALGDKDLSSFIATARGLPGFDQGVLDRLEQGGTFSDLLNLAAGGWLAKPEFLGQTGAIGQTTVGMLRQNFASAKGLFGSVGEQFLPTVDKSLIESINALRSTFFSMLPALGIAGGENTALGTIGEFLPKGIRVAGDWVRRKVEGAYSEDFQSFESMEEFWDRSVKWMKEFGEWMKSYEPAMNVVLEMFSAMSTSAGGNSLFRTFSELVVDNRDAFIRLGESIGRVFHALFGAFGSGQDATFRNMDKIVGVFTTIAESLVPAFVDLAGALSPIFDILPDAIRGISGIVRALTPLIELFANTIGVTASGVSAIPGGDWLVGLGTLALLRGGGKGGGRGRGGFGGRILRGVGNVGRNTTFARGAGGAMGATRFGGAVRGAGLAGAAGAGFSWLTSLDDRFFASDWWGSQGPKLSQSMQRGSSLANFTYRRLGGGIQPQDPVTGRFMRNPTGAWLRGESVRPYSLTAGGRPAGRPAAFFDDVAKRAPRLNRAANVFRGPIAKLGGVATLGYMGYDAFSDFSEGVFPGTSIHNRWMESPLLAGLDAGVASSALGSVFGLGAGSGLLGLGVGGAATAAYSGIDAYRRGETTGLNFLGSVAGGAATGATLTSIFGPWGALGGAIGGGVFGGTSNIVASYFGRQRRQGRARKAARNLPDVFDVTTDEELKDAINTMGMIEKYRELQNAGVEELWNTPLAEQLAFTLDPDLDPSAYAGGRKQYWEEVERLDRLSTLHQSASGFSEEFARNLQSLSDMFKLTSVEAVELAEKIGINLVDGINEAERRLAAIASWNLDPGVIHMPDLLGETAVGREVLKDDFGHKIDVFRESGLTGDQAFMISSLQDAIDSGTAYHLAEGVDQELAVLGSLNWMSGIFKENLGPNWAATPEGQLLAQAEFAAINAMAEDIGHGLSAQGLYDIYSGLGPGSGPGGVGDALDYFRVYQSLTTGDLVPGTSVDDVIGFIRDQDLGLPEDYFDYNRLFANMSPEEMEKRIKRIAEGGGTEGWLTLDEVEGGLRDNKSYIPGARHYFQAIALGLSPEEQMRGLAQDLRDFNRFKEDPQFGPYRLEQESDPGYYRVSDNIENLLTDPEHMSPLTLGPGGLMANPNLYAAALSEALPLENVVDALKVYVVNPKDIFDGYQRPIPPGEPDNGTGTSPNNLPGITAEMQSIVNASSPGR